MTFHGKKKAVTFSYDDGVIQDRRLVPLLNRYGLKATFNINSARLGGEEENPLCMNGKRIPRNTILKEELPSLYRGHEVAAHTLTHPALPYLSDEEIVREVEEDRIALSELVGYEVVGMAYPCGGFQNSDRVERVIRSRTGVRYARTISLGYSFAPQENLYRYKPTAYHTDYDANFHLAKEFLESEEGIFYIWGHSYEFEVEDSWSRFEELCALLAGRKDIFYGTNKEILLDLNQGK